MAVSYADKYAFLGEWYDNDASLVRQFAIYYYPFDDTVEMYDLRNKKTFAKRLKITGVTLDTFYIGCTIPIYGRLIKIVDFGCEDTRKRLQKECEVTFAMIKPMSNVTAGKILTHLHENQLKVSKMKMALLTVDDINYIFSHLVLDSTYPFILEALSGKHVYGLELVGSNIYERLLKTVGKRDPTKADPGTIRALYGIDIVRNCMHYSPDDNKAKKDLAYFFPPPGVHASHLRLTATLSNCTLCIVKPHAVKEGKVGGVLQVIDEGGFDITALYMFIVENVNCSEFYEVYKGIVPEYKGMVDELASGPCVAMEIVSKNKSVSSAAEFRKLVGPSDPEIARLLRPNTLRARFGINKVKNAIHCSDLPEDGLLEVEYFFKILDL